MLTLFGALLGFISSLVPSIFKLLKEKEDRSHELKILDRQMEVLKLKHSNRLEEIQSFTDIEELKSLYQYPKTLGIKWVDGLSGSVRPIITYSFFILYWIVKVSHIIYIGKLVTEGSGLAMLSSVWQEEDQALFAAVMSFWFGQRAMGKVKR